MSALLLFASFCTASALLATSSVNQRARSPRMVLAASSVNQRTRSPRMVGGGAAGTAAGGGGDLSGGGDSERNKQIATLRNLFNAPDAIAEETSESSSDVDNARKLGLLRDLPLCRYSWCLLPGHQIAMSVWQPQYTLMFNRLLADPAPHYYLHVLLPGGAESLGEPGYELEPGSKSSLMGTLCRVAVAQRNQDSTLTLVVQGLGRGVVLRPTQMLPYSRGDVQLLPDSEALLASALASERAMAKLSIEAPPSRAIRRRMVAAGAAAELEAYLPYEAQQISVDAGGHLAPLNQFNASAGAAVFEAAPLAMEAALVGITMPREEPDELFSGSEATRLLDEAMDSATDSAAGATLVVEGLETLEMLEVQTWLELDVLLQTMRKTTQRAVPIPSQILGLLPPAPESGWPEDFELQVVAARLALDYNLQNEAYIGPDGDVRKMSYVPVDAAYPARKRAERLSWVIWAIIGNQKIGVNAYGGSPYQKVIEAEGTSERLRLVLMRLREIQRELQA